MGIADNAMLPEPLAAVAIVVGLAPGYLLAVLLPVLGAFGLKFSVKAADSASTCASSSGVAKAWR